MKFSLPEEISATPAKKSAAEPAALPDAKNLAGEVSPDSNTGITPKQSMILEEFINGN
jgi:hypothetical protein